MKIKNKKVTPMMKKSLVSAVDPVLTPEGKPIKFYTASEIAKMYGLSVVTIINNINKGLLKARRIGKWYRISEQDIKEWLDKTIINNTEVK